jgi:hypothetical protein
MPFLCHLVRTASIVLEEGQGIDVVVAALLHSAYRLDDHDRSSKRAGRAIARRYLRKRVGPEAEEIVWANTAFGWTRADVARHLERLETYPPAVRKALTINVANDLELHLDLAMLFGPQFRPGRTVGRPWPERDQLARELGVSTLIAQLDAVVAETLRRNVPAGLIRPHVRAYERPPTVLWRKTLPERIYTRVSVQAARHARRLVRGVRQPRRALAVVRRRA